MMIDFTLGLIVGVVGITVIGEFIAHYFPEKTSGYKQGHLDGYVKGKEEGYWEGVNDSKVVKNDNFDEELEKEIQSAFMKNTCKVAECTGLSYSTFERIAHYFANWQKQQDQETIEVAEDHAMLAGMEKMKQQMLKEAVECKIVSYGASKRLVFDNSEFINAWHKYKAGSKLEIIFIKNEK